MHVDWNGILNSDDCSVNFESFCKMVKTTMDGIAPTKHVRILGKRHFAEPWMTTGLETASQNNKKLYLETLRKNCPASVWEKYKSGRNLLNRLKRSTMKSYYTTKCTEYKDNTKKALACDKPNNRENKAQWEYHPLYLNGWDQNL